VPITVGTVGGYMLYKIVPEVYGKFKELFGNFFLKTVYVTLQQNRVKAINIIKFISGLDMNKDIKSVSIAIDDEEYEVPIVEVKVMVDDTVNISFKVHTDNNYNITYIEVSTWKRESLKIDEKKIASFNKVMATFPSVTKAKPTVPVVQVSNEKGSASKGSVVQKTEKSDKDVSDIKDWFW